MFLKVVDCFNFCKYKDLSATVFMLKRAFTSEGSVNLRSRNIRTLKQFVAFQETKFNFSSKLQNPVLVRFP